ncbi:hypothetical protein P2G88_13340 [Aliiglaciecola sp. CAU 1673]|uniref:WD40 repeat domain-containing protein n=1 Tax=Aliiglaciecola sp. CAU 1673 TaxID=3032595 RepID=UPI0023DB31AA|nr:hypothetical protein [Aliiglaciecola sp. CAU 1673]MDF2179238.1 hypothetical protein [Aliiglaciecola sp. CAU 1673]
MAACSLPGSEALESHIHAEGGSLAAAISQDGTLSIVSSIEQGLKVWDLKNNKIKFEWRHQGEGDNLVANIHIAFDKAFAVTADREAFALWNLSTGDPEGFWRIDESSVRAVAVADGGQALLVGRSNGKVLFFEPATGRRLEFLGHQERINSLDLSPNGFYALTGSNDYVAYLWDTRSGQVIFSFQHPSRVTKVALDPWGRYAFTADSKDNARIWDLRNGQQVSQLHFLERQKIFTAAKFSEDGKYLLTGSPARGLNLWQVATGNEEKGWRVAPREGSKPQSAVVYDVGFLTSRRVLSESSSGLAEVWAY